MWGALAAHPGFPAMVARRMGGDRDAMAQVMASMSVGHQDCVADTLALAGESFPVVLAAGSEDAKYAALTESLAGGAVAAGAGKAVRDALRGVARRGLVGVVVEGRGHAIPTECPDAVLGLVRWVAGDGE